MLQELKTREAEMGKLKENISQLTETAAQREAHFKTIQEDLVKATNENKNLQDNFEKVCINMYAIILIYTVCCVQCTSY